MLMALTRPSPQAQAAHLSLTFTLGSGESPGDALRET